MCKTSTLLRFLKEIRQKLVEERQVFFSSRFFLLLLNIKKFKVFDQVVFDSFFHPSYIRTGPVLKLWLLVTISLGTSLKMSTRGKKSGP